MTTAPWLDEAKTADLAQTAQRLGLAVKTGMRLRLQCPACGATRSGRSDKRPPCSAGNSGHWRCWVCTARGDVVDLVSYVVAGDRYSGQPGVREWWTGERGAMVERVERREPAPRRYPPDYDVRVMMFDCLPWYEDREVREWVGQRLGPSGEVFTASDLPGLPVLDADGAIRSVRARRVCSDNGTPKALPPAGYDCGGLVLANKLGRLVLLGEGYTQHVIVCEGEPAFLAWSLARPESAVFGIGSGWWTKGHADKIATGSTVVIATDDDDAGKRYATHVRSTLGGRCVVQRWTG